MPKYLHLEPRSSPVQGVEFKELATYIRELIDHLGDQLGAGEDDLAKSIGILVNMAVDQKAATTSILATLDQQGRVLAQLGMQLASVVEFLVPPPAIRAVLQVNGEENMATITVDTTGATATLTWEDDKGDVDAAPPAGVVATFTSDTPTVLAVNNDTTNLLQGDLTAGVEGTAVISVALTNADGTPLLLQDGTTPFPTPAPVSVTVGAGAAISAAETVTP